MSKNLARAAISGLAAAIGSAATWGATLDPLATFGNGGWRAPGVVLSGDSEDAIDGDVYRYLSGYVYNLEFEAHDEFGELHLERGMAYNPTTGNLILASRRGGDDTFRIRILDGATGVDKGALDPGFEVLRGGTFALDMIGVADDGAIYLGNLTTNTGTSPFKIYRWASETALEPTVAFDSDVSGGVLAGARMGDTFDVIGSGPNTRLVAGYGSNPNVPGNNSFALFDTSDGLNFTATNVAIASSPPNAGDFRLGITFADDDTIMGTQGQLVAGNTVRVVDVTGNSGTMSANFSTDGSTLRPMDYAVVGGKPILAIAEASADVTSPSARARIFVYDMSNPELPLEERKIGETSALPAGFIQGANVNGTGQVKFGAIDGNTAILYAMSTNNGIEAFRLTLDATSAENGDFDDDGDVDGDDFLAWQNGYGINDGTALRTDGDANSDDKVTDADFAIWGRQFGSNTASLSVVPEPHGTALLASALLGGSARRRTRRSS